MFDIILSAEPVLSNLIGKFIKVLFDGIGNYGWTVVVFTIILKVALSPLDVWQKIATRKQSKAMARVKPQMEKLQRQYANNPDMLKLKQSELYRKEKIGFFGSCLPMIVTMVVFFVIFGGFNAMVRYQNEYIVYDLRMHYEAGARGDELLAVYQQNIQGWLWIKNVFMPDSWSNIVPTAAQFVGTGWGQIGAEFPVGVSASEYEAYVAPAVEFYNKTNFWDIKRWNGYLILPILSIVTSLFSSKLMQYTMPQNDMTAGMDPEAKKKNDMSQKIMMIMMPLIFGLFSIFYSAAFTIYMFVSSLFTTVFNLIFNIFMKRKDKREQDAQLSKTYIR